MSEFMVVGRYLSQFQKDTEEQAGTSGYIEVLLRYL